MQEPSQQTVEPKQPRSEKKIVIIALLLCIGILLVGALLLTRMFFTSSQSNGAVTEEKKEVTDLVKKVGMLMEIPKETPTVATVADKTKLKDQVFFAQAENGDKVLIFTDAKKAVLYRPFTNKIIEVTTLNVTYSSNTPTISPSQTVLLSPTQAK